MSFSLPLKSLVVGLFVALAAPAQAETDFATWLADVRVEALKKGISQATVDAALGSNLKPIPRVVELDRKQPEFTMTFRGYMSRLVSQDRIRKAKTMLATHGKDLNVAAKKYGVPARFLVAFWGVETDFGRLADGYFPVIGALATLAHDGRRSAFFRDQLFQALQILDAGHISLDKMKGSWAGAMGHFQFIPSTFNAYAVDADGDGKRNIWGNRHDAFASAANFLSQVGWKEGETWGREVKIPQGFDLELVDSKTTKPLQTWADLGVIKAEGQPLSVIDGMEASLILPAGAEGPAFLIYNNFNTTLNWNRSIFYALAVGHLADRMIGKGPLVNPGPKGERIALDQVKAMQDALNRLGFDVGQADGVAGPKTRSAVRAFQRANGLPPDGHPSLKVMQAIRIAAEAS